MIQYFKIPIKIEKRQKLVGDEKHGYHRKKEEWYETEVKTKFSYFEYSKKKQIYLKEEVYFAKEIFLVIDSDVVLKTKGPKARKRKLKEFDVFFKSNDVYAVPKFGSKCNVMKTLLLDWNEIKGLCLPAEKENIVDLYVNHSIQNMW